MIAIATMMIGMMIEMMIANLMIEMAKQMTELVKKGASAATSAIGD